MSKEAGSVSSCMCGRGRERGRAVTTVPLLVDYEQMFQHRRKNLC